MENAKQTETVASPETPPLTGLRVLDLAIGPLAAIGRLLAELGADVLRIDPPGGAPDRAQGPIAAGVSLSFTGANLGKRGLTLDLHIPAGRNHFQNLAAGADILIDTGTPGVDPKTLRAHHPALVILSASNFGASGDFAHWQATCPVLHALSGELSRSGIPGRAPLLPPGDLTHECAVGQAAFVILLAYWNRLKTGQGDHLDFSLLDAACQALDPGYGISGSATVGTPASELPRDRPDARHLYPIIPCADGAVRLCILAPRQWQGMFEWLGRPAEFADKSFNTLQVRFASKTLIPAIAAFFAGQTRADLEVDGQRHGVPTAAVLDFAEALASDQVKARQALAPVRIAPDCIAPDCIATFPNGMIAIDGHRQGIRGPAPALDEQTAPRWRPRPASPADIPAGDRPLAGLRVLDFGVIVVGAEQGRLLADQGADVMKVENAAFPDGSRQSRTPGPVSPTFATGHRNKRSLGLNLRHPEGLALLRRLIPQTDVILSNFKPGTLESLGLDYASLAEINPGIIVVDSSAFGPTGPWSRRLGYGPLVRASSGLTTQWRYPDDPASFSDTQTVYPDHVAARIGIVGVLALLIRRLRTGRGGSVSVAQNEVMLGHFAADVAATGLGIAAPPQDAPWGVFPCAGDDEWCVVTVRHDADFQSLCTAIGRADLTELATPATRNTARARIDAALTAWLADRTPRDAMTALQQAGVPAAAMLRVADLPTFPYYAQRGFFRLVEHKHLPAPFYLETAPVRSEHLPDPPERPAPALGEHTASILHERLGIAPEEIKRLVTDGILEIPKP